MKLDGLSERRAGKTGPVLMVCQRNTCTHVSTLVRPTAILNGYGHCNLAQMRTLMRLPGKGILPYGQIRTFWYV